jgi:protein tyrosine/serine phosphatase
VSTTTSRWIELDGADNARDLGGLPTVDGRTVRPLRLIRSDSLQTLTDADVRYLVDELDVRAVADLRTGVEVDSEGPGPMTREPLVQIRHLSLFPEAGVNTDAVADENLPDNPANTAPVVLPWQTRAEEMSEEEQQRGAAGIYLRYLLDRADSIVDALRLIAATDGATIVHCAAGKDRTGVVVAFALAEVGVEPEAIVADYALSAERVEATLRRMAGRRTYAADVTADVDVDKHTPRPETMRQLLAALDARYGGVPGWLRAHGWTDADGAALRARLLE